MRGMDGSNRVGRGSGPEIPGGVGGRHNMRGIGRGSSGSLPPLSGSWNKISLPLGHGFSRALRLETESATLFREPRSKRISLLIDSSRDSQMLMITLSPATGRITISVASRRGAEEELIVDELKTFATDIHGRITFISEAKGDVPLRAEPAIETEPKASWDIEFPEPAKPSAEYSRSLMTMNKWLSMVLKDLQEERMLGAGDAVLERDISLLNALFQGVSENLRALAQPR